ncbi:hypothetical protein SNE40_000751 [Patella caerulea]|uniref:Carbohydrate sulfotransferase n=1 Tax=Patella caerulea TaxID=87958 RepID=A0AAN8KEH7_PATCE
MEHIFSTRRKRIRDACLLDNRGRVQGLMIYKAANLSYCVVPKAGCTFWKRIFRFLNGDTGNSDIISPFKINRMIVHYGSYKHMGRLSFSNMTDRYFLPIPTVWSWPGIHILGCGLCISINSSSPIFGEVTVK